MVEVPPDNGRRKTVFGLAKASSGANVLPFRSFRLRESAHGRRMTTVLIEPTEIVLQTFVADLFRLVSVLSDLGRFVAYGERFDGE